MKHKLLATALLFCGVAIAQVSFGIQIGPPPPPRVLAVRPVMPGPGYTWVDGYWYPVGSRYHWHDGYWTRPPYDGATWVAPYHDGHQFFAGHWEGNRGRVEHDHRWDRERNRDWNRGHDRH